MFKRFAPQIALLVIICLIATLGYIKTQIIATNSIMNNTPTVIIDAGHAALENTID